MWKLSWFTFNIDVVPDDVLLRKNVFYEYTLYPIISYINLKVNCFIKKRRNISFFALAKKSIDFYKDVVYNIFSYIYIYINIII